MGYTSLRRSPKKEEQEVPDAITLPHSNEAYADEEFNILDELDGVLDNIEKEQKFPTQKTYSSGELHWDFMQWEEFPTIGEEAEDDEEGKVHVTENNRSKCLMEEQQIKRENIVGFWEEDHEDEKMMALNLNLNYQEVLDAWSDRGSLWADDYSFSMANINNGYYVSTHHPIFYCHEFRFLAFKKIMHSCIHIY